MKITLDIKDSRFAYFMDMLKNLDFVKVISRENENAVAEPAMTHYASQKALEKDWLTPEEDEAWKDL